MTEAGAKLAIGSDHAGFHMKEDLKSMLVEMGYEVEDMGTHDTNSCDYPDFAEAVAHSETIKIRI